MQTSNEIVSSYATAQRFQTKPLADNERNAVAYFFMKLRIADPRFYDQAMPDETTEKFTKREFSEFIRGFTKEKIDKGFLNLHKFLADSHPDYKFLTIQKVIGLVENGGAGEAVQSGAFKLFPRMLGLEDQTEKAKRYELGKKKSSELLSMLGVEAPKPEQSNEYALAQLEKAKRILANKTEGSK
jgi:hypothetical protein